MNTDSIWTLSGELVSGKVDHAGTSWGPHENSRLARADVELLAMRCKLERLYNVEVDKNCGELQLSHVPNKDRVRHRLTLSRHEL